MATNKRKLKSTIKPKNQTKPWKLLPCAALLWGSMTPSWAVINISNLPLSSVGTVYGPNVVLALSVEYPTAGRAYSDTTLTADTMTKRYRGYFDNTKCYTYDGNAFIPTEAASDWTIDGKKYLGLCSNRDAQQNLFSGNALNFLTMSAADIFRQTMTGGNRAYGTGTDASNYENGDKLDATYLRRANLVWYNEPGTKWYAGDTKEGNEFTKYVELNNWSPNTKVIMGGVLPWSFISQNANSISFINKGFTVQIQSKYYLAGWSSDYGGVTESGKYDYEDPKGQYYRPGNSCRFIRRNKYTCHVVEINNSIKNETYNVVNQVCNPNKGLESNCVKYGDHYKPEGLLQQYTAQGMRVAAMGYLNTHDNNIGGGVLRARMKQLNQQSQASNGNKLNPEWSTTTGQLFMNPDADDANSGAVKVSNSGVINYLNKFGDSSGYKIKDPGAELYYTALRYLRNGAWANTATSQGDGTAPYRANNVDATKADGFPVLYNWDDPMKEKTKNGSFHLNQCRSNSIIYIGDTNTASNDAIGETRLPNFLGTSNSPTDTIQTKTYLQHLVTQEGLDNDKYYIYKTPFTLDPSLTLSTQNNRGGMPALAYWARNNDIRPDIPGNQYGNNFVIDVAEPLENNTEWTYKVYSGKVKNQLYLAAKYGGFNRDLLTPDSNGFLNPNDNRLSWTDNAVNNSSDGNFQQGMPRNFAIANEPDTMDSALQKAMAYAGAQNGVSQTNMGTVNNETNTVDLTGSDNLVVRSSFNTRDWSGDVMVYSVSAQTTSGSNKANGLKFNQVWSLGNTLTTAYHGEGYKNRNVFTWKNNAAKKIDPNTADNLTKYILGDPTNEGTTSDKYRVRSSLLGTVVNSQVVGFRAKDTNGKDTGPYYFAVASNDGILHVFKVNKNNNALSGSEVFAYIPEAAMNGLKNYASQDYSHRYLNDGSPTVKTLKVGNENKTYLVGSTGRGDSDPNGKSAVYVVDVTNPDKPALLWEFNANGNLGHILGEPVVTLDKAGKPVAIVSSGYSSSGVNDANSSGFVYILDIGSKTYQSVKLGAANVGAVTGYDSDGDQKVDRIYVGDDSGKLWRVDNTSGSDWNLPYRDPDSNNTGALYKPDHARPITGTPYAQKIKGKLYVLAGTGRYLNSSDLSANQQNYAYGFIDDCNLADSPSCKTIKEDDLLKQSITGTPAELAAYNGISLTESSRNTITQNQRGWQISLRQGMLIAGHASVEKNRLAAFPIVSQNPLGDNECSANGETSGLFVDIMNGSQFKQPIFDTNGDGVVDAQDQVGSLLTMVQMMNPERGILHTTSGNFAFASIDGIGGIKLVVPEDKPIGIHRLSWREIF